jgi:hypothetical protein
MANRQRSDVEERLLEAARAWYKDRARRNYTANNPLLTTLFKACREDSKVSKK